MSPMHTLVFEEKLIVDLKKNILHQFLSGSFLALLDCVSRAIAVARASSVKRIFSETVKQINAKFCGKVAVQHISRLFFPFLKILDF